MEKHVLHFFFSSAFHRFLPPVCPLNHRLVCHLSSAVKPVIERPPSGCLFVFRASIKLSWHLAWILSRNGPSFHPVPFISIIDLWWNITNPQLLLCASLNSVRGQAKQVIGSWWFSKSNDVFKWVWISSGNRRLPAFLTYCCHWINYFWSYISTITLKD